jgi:DNA mismatch repair ATPase MutS
LLPRLCRRLGWTETGGPMHAFLNAAVFYDLHIAVGVLGPVLRGRDALLAGLSGLAEIEALLSLACFAWEQPVTCYPVPVSEPTVSIVGGIHPFIAPDLAVPNDVKLTPTTRMWVITGPNMGGKSTFLRMVGTNVLLAQIGTAAAARQMSWTPLRLITDLRARDSLSKNESYFLAEVRQVRRMVLAEAGGAPILGLIDEPLRGTNSAEHVASSAAVLEHLRDSPHLFLVATHEQQLTELAGDSKGSNHHFREEVDSSGLLFDYHLRPGRARTRNALEILQREGYPQSLVERARQWLDQRP